VSAQRCSNEWKPPGVIALPGVPVSMNEGIVWVTCCHALGRPQTMPVPRGPKSHLWHPAAKKSQPRAGSLTFSTPKPWTPSTQSRIRSASLRSRLRRPSASAIRRIGSLTPVLECTHVSATTRVRSDTAAVMRWTIAVADAAELWSYSETFRTDAPVRSAFRAKASWVTKKSCVEVSSSWSARTWIPLKSRASPMLVLSVRARSAALPPV
jgi:hypothetical protein